MSKRNMPKGRKTVLWDLVVPGGIARSTIRVVLESDGENVTAEGQVSIELGPRVDRDHDHLLREFMEASDEVEAAAINSSNPGGSK